LDAYHHPNAPRWNFPLFDLLFLCSHIACLFPLWNHLACFGPTISPFGIKSLKKSKTKWVQGNQQVLANIAQREMLNTREKATWTMIHIYDINEDTTCRND
jgi:hypothetical protein